jgi:hypothetical protein
MAGKLGVDPQQPENAALERELRYLYATRAGDVRPRVAAGAAEHTERMLQLEQEDASRFPIRTPTDSLRAGKGSQARAGQPLGR